MAIGMLTKQQFDRTRRLALNLAGIELFDRHREVLVRRGRRMGVLDSAGLDALLTAAEAGEPAATQRLLCLVTTKFTGFFRNPRHFDLVAKHAFMVAGRGGPVRLWSAAAATGEEPYSLAMAMIEIFQRDDPPVQVLATDLVAEALVVARRGEFGELALRSLEPARRERFFDATPTRGRWVLNPAVRRLVKFQTLNLVDRVWGIEGLFDAIFCRNVLMYLETAHRQAVLERMARLLDPEGLLLLDPAEHLGKAAPLFMPQSEGVYLRRPLSALPRGLTPLSVVTCQ